MTRYQRLARRADERTVRRFRAYLLDRLSVELWMEAARLRERLERMAPSGTPEALPPASDVPLAVHAA
jgi:hypothetical protein